MDERTIAANATVCSLIQQVRTALVHPNSSSITAYDAVSRIISLLPRASLEGCVDSSSSSEQKMVLYNKYFACFAGMLTENYCSNWLEPDKDGQVLDQLFTDAFIRGPPEDCFVVLCHAVSMHKDGSTFKIHRIATLLTTTLKDNNCIMNMMESRCIIPSEHIPYSSDREALNVRLVSVSQSILSTIVSLPDIITPNLGSSPLSVFFFPKSYVPFLCTQISIFLRRVYDLLGEGRNCSVFFVSALMGKMSAVGYAESMWDCLLKEFIVSGTNDFLFQTILQRVMNNVPNQWIEATIVPLVANACSTSTLKAFLGPIAVNNAKISYILTHKLLLVRCYKDSRILQNIIGYLNSCDAVKPLFMKSFSSLLHAWEDGSSLRHRPLEQSLYICKAIVISIAHLKQDSDLARQVLGIVRQCMLNGLTHYLDSPETQIRHMGCFVAEQLSLLIAVRGEPAQSLNFELVPNKLTQSLLDLLYVADVNQDENDSVSLDVSSTNKLKSQGSESNTIKSSKISLNSGQSVVNKCDSSQSSSRAKCKTEVNKISLPARPVFEALDSDDDENELEPFPNAINESGTLHCKRPVYLGQCMEGLLHTEDADLVEQCLIHSESLVRSNPESSEMAVEFARILLHLEDRFSLTDFAFLRRRALIAVVTCSPAQMAQYLAGEFYMRNYNVGQRMDILEVLSAGARELSLPSVLTSSTNTITNCELRQNLGIVKSQQDSNVSNDCINLKDSKSWQEIVRIRIDSKTRRFAAGRRQPLPEPVKNRFAMVAGNFLFPLMQNFDDSRLDRHLDLVGCDHLLLVRLLHTLGVVIYAATHAPGIARMAKSLLEFTWCFRGHVQSAVRQAVLYAVCMTIVALPSCMLVDQLDTEVVADLKDWLEQEVIERDTDSECRNLGLQTLRLLSAAIREEMDKRVC